MGHSKKYRELLFFVDVKEAEVKVKVVFLVNIMMS
jgi:hypothetical protein